MRAHRKVRSHRTTPTAIQKRPNKTMPQPWMKCGACIITAECSKIILHVKCSFNATPGLAICCGSKPSDKLGENDCD